MLQLQTIRENKEGIITALKKRNLDIEPILSAVLDLDEKRRSIQTELDATLAESNKLSKEIGILFKSGKAEEANTLKEQTAGLKEASKQLGEELNATAEALQEQ
ncbi:MAG: serine--tRNA ligase, partial [Allomuricauda sp.]